LHNIDLLVGIPTPGRITASSTLSAGFANLRAWAATEPTPPTALSSDEEEPLFEEEDTIPGIIQTQVDSFDSLEPVRNNLSHLLIHQKT
jgi:hypothetical protein